jgi:hypothetical protein
MAEMIPPKLWDPDLKSEGERKTFEALRDGLSDRWQVYHSASWVVRDPVDGALDGEIDFVLCHPDEGVIVQRVGSGPRSRSTPATPISARSSTLPSTVSRSARSRSSIGYRLRGMAR